MSTPTLLTGLLLAATVASAQHVVSARAGMIQLAAGDVYVEQDRLSPAHRQFPELRNGQVLRTDLGRAEMLLSPGVFLRVSENARLRMDSSRLDDTRLTLLAGSVIVEALDLAKDNVIQVACQDATVNIERAGLYRIDASPARIRVYDGAARVTAGNRAITVKRGRASDLGPALQVASFDTKTGDALSRWSARRSGHLAIANLPAALALRGTLWSSSGVGWVWNPYFGLFTFVPAQAVRSYLGYAYHSPGTAGEAAAGAIRKPKDPWPDGIHSFGYSVYAGRGYDAGDRGPGVAYGGVSAPSAGSANSPAAAPPVESPRSGDSATPRGSDGGGRGQ